MFVIMSFDSLDASTLFISIPVIIKSLSINMLNIDLYIF